MFGGDPAVLHRPEDSGNLELKGALRSATLASFPGGNPLPTAHLPGSRVHAPPSIWKTQTSLVGGVLPSPALGLPVHVRARDGG